MWTGRKTALAFLWFATASCLTCNAGWNANIWPASNTSPREIVTTNVYAKDMWSWQCNSALVERASILQTAPPDLPTFFRFEKANVDAFKEWIEAECTNFVDWTLATGGNYNAWFTDTNNTWFPMLSVTTLINRLSLPANFFDYTPWRAINQSSNGWDGVRNCITSLVWTVHSTAYNYGTNQLTTNNFGNSGDGETYTQTIDGVSSSGTNYWNNSDIFYDCDYSPNLGYTNIIIDNEWNFTVAKKYNCSRTMIQRIGYWFAQCMLDEETDSEGEITYNRIDEYTLNRTDEYDDYILDISFHSVTGYAADVQMYEMITINTNQIDTTYSNSYQTYNDNYEYSACTCSKYDCIYSIDSCTSHNPAPWFFDRFALDLIINGTNTIVTNTLNNTGIPSPLNTNYNRYYTRYSEAKTVNETNILFNVEYELNADPIDTFTYYDVGVSSQSCTDDGYNHISRHSIYKWIDNKVIDNQFIVRSPIGLFEWEFEYD